MIQGFWSSCGWGHECLCEDDNDEVFMNFQCACPGVEDIFRRSVQMKRHKAGCEPLLETLMSSSLKA